MIIGEKSTIFLSISLLVIYPIIQSFAIAIQTPEHPADIVTFDRCQYPHDGLVSTYVFQGPLTNSNAVDKSMDNNNKKNINLKISNFEYFLDPDKNITKGYISIVQPNASSYNSTYVHNTYTMCTNYLDNKPPKTTLVYIEPLHYAYIIKEINLKGTTNINPALKIASIPKEFKLQLSGITNINSTTEMDYLKEIKGLLKIGSTEASINNIVMDISWINS